MNLFRRIKQQSDAWIAKRLPPLPVVTLNQSKIMIFPSRQGFMLLLVAMVVLLLAINFESSLNYALGFWLIAMIWSAVHLTYRNLSGLTLKAERAALVEAGEEAEYTIRLCSESDRFRGPLELIHPDWGLATAVMDGDDVVVPITRETHRRGRHPLPRFRLESRYPFGLMIARAYVQLDLSAWAYPVPVNQDAHRQGGAESGDAADDHFIHAGTEDFHSLREYEVGDAMHRIHWPSFARDQLVVKAFVDYQVADEWLDWNAFPSLVAEQRLAALSWQINQCVADDRPYGLRLPGTEIAPGKGPAHTERCRRALAEFGETS